MSGSISSINRLWVFSDLHLSNPQSSLYQSFLKALDEPNTPLDVVVFAGDIFEIFVGNSSYFMQKHALFIKAIELLHSRKVQMYYIEGNHDFHLESAFRKNSVHILDSELVLNSSRAKIFIAHGDLVDQNDHGYLWMRKAFRSRTFKAMAKLFPGKAVEMVGEFIARSHEQKERDLSRQPGETPKVRPVFRAYAEEKKRQGFDFVILGHCHDLDDLQPFYFNMGYPPVHRQFLFYSAESNSFKRRVFTGI